RFFSLARPPHNIILQHYSCPFISFLAFLPSLPPTRYRALHAAPRRVHRSAVVTRSLDGGGGFPSLLGTFTRSLLTGATRLPPGDRRTASGRARPSSSSRPRRAHPCFFFFFLILHLFAVCPPTPRCA